MVAGAQCSSHSDSDGMPRDLAEAEKQDAVVGLLKKFPPFAGLAWLYEFSSLCTLLLLLFA